MLQFNNKGYLQPEGVIECDWETFSDTFVFNQNRAELFDEFNLFLNELKTILATSFYIWVDGSFMSKRSAPRDVDVVVFVNYDIYENNEVKFKNLRGKWKSVDCYFVKEYPAEHQRYLMTDFDKTEYLHLFSTDRKKNRKGFIQLNF